MHWLECGAMHVHARAHTHARTPLHAPLHARSDILGSVSDYTLRMSRASLCIVRSTGAKMGKQSKILFAADGSHASNLAFSFLTHL